MTIASESVPTRDPLRAKLTKAPLDRIPDDWIPPRDAWLPRIRIGKHWYSILWAVPIAAVGLIIFIAICQWLRTVPGVEDFLVRYPGVPVQQPPVYSGFPLWVRVQHFLNMFFMYFIMRAGMQIFADHPRAYWNRNCTPDTEWMRISHPVPAYRLWTAKDDAVTLPGWLGIPGIRHTIGLARWWHFSVNMLWVINGVLFCILLFATDQWMRLVPLTWDVIPNAVSTAIKYGSLDFPPPEAWPRFNSLQQLTYFFTFFIVAPLQITTGLLQGPAFSNRLGWFGRTFNRQVARSIHILGFSWFVFFIIVHGVFVFATSLKANTNHMFYGVESPDWVGLPYFIVCMAVLVVAWLVATPLTIRHARKVQKTGRFLIGGLKRIAEFWDPTTEEREKDISPHHWPNHHSLPNSPEYLALLAGNFEGYRLRIGGLVENPVELSYAELKAMPKQSQITTHFCIQGWSSCGKWSGAQMRHILDLVKPTKEARYVAFYSYSTGDDGGIYYECHRMHNMHHKLSILAYEFNDEPLRVLHGAPVRLRVENELGFKLVKWVQAIEFIKDFRQLGAGQGGYNEDHEFYGYRMPI